MIARLGAHLGVSTPDRSVKHVPRHCSAAPAGSSQLAWARPRFVILDLLAGPQSKQRMAMVFISHDLAAVEYLADGVLKPPQGRLIDSE